MREYNKLERGVHSMNSRNKQVLSGYTKYLFMTKEEAEMAKKSLGKKFPNLKMKTTEHGGLFCQTHDSLLYELPILAAVTALGGTKA